MNMYSTIAAYIIRDYFSANGDIDPPGFTAASFQLASQAQFLSTMKVRPAEVWSLRSYMSGE